MAMSRNAMLAASSVHKIQNPQHFQHNNTSQFYTTTTPGSVNILLGGVFAIKVNALGCCRLLIVLIMALIVISTIIVSVQIKRAMLGTMVLFFVWMCYFCRCKVPKSEETSSTSSTPPYWIDIENEMNDRGGCDEEYYHSYRRYSEDISSLRRLSPPPTYESVFNLPPTYEDAMKSFDDEKEIKEQ